VRRALAQAGRKAVEVDGLCVAAAVAPTAEACRRLARRALGPHGSAVPVLAVAITTDRTEAIGGHRADAIATGAAAVVEAAAVGDGASVEDWALAVCVGLGADGTTVALCLER
jgi:hypothetical protein